MSSRPSRSGAGSESRIGRRRSTKMSEDDMRTMLNFKVESWDDDVQLSQDRLHRFYTNEEYLFLKRLFDKHDPKSNGYINSRYLRDIFKKAGQNPTIKQDEKMKKDIQANDTGMILFEEMLDLFEKYWKSRDMIELELEQAFRSFAIDKDGVELVDLAEMDSFLVNHGEKLEKDEFKLLSRELNGVMERSAARFELLQSVMSTETKQSDALKTTKIKEAANKERHVDLKDLMHYFSESELGKAPVGKKKKKKSKKKTKKRVKGKK